MQVATGIDWAAVSSLATAVPRPNGVVVSYGTAGFRAKASVLPSTFLRMGFLAALRSQQTGQVLFRLQQRIVVFVVDHGHARVMTSYQDTPSP